MLGTLDLKLQHIKRWSGTIDNLDFVFVDETGRLHAASDDRQLFCARQGNDLANMKFEVIRVAVKILKSSLDQAAR